MNVDHDLGAECVVAVNQYVPVNSYELILQRYNVIMRTCNVIMKGDVYLSLDYLPSVYYILST